MKSKKIIIATVSTIVAIAILWFCFGGKSKSANYVIETAQAVRGDVSEAVTATGTIGSHKSKSGHKYRVSSTNCMPTTTPS